MQASKDFEAGVRESEHLEVIGEPRMSVVAFKAKQPKRVNIFRVNDNMTSRGWHLSALQLPSALHMCFTAQHVGVIKELLQVPSSTPPCNA
jgi:sphinganine-1-phosphate aldolase